MTRNSEILKGKYGKLRDLPSVNGDGFLRLVFYANGPERGFQRKQLAEFAQSDGHKRKTFAQDGLIRNKNHIKYNNKLYNKLANR